MGVLLENEEHKALLAARDFAQAVVREAAHQAKRWEPGHDEGKMPEDWYWLLGHLGGRVLSHHKEGERLALMLRTGAGNLSADVLRASVQHHREKAVHHTITAAAALAHWHARVVRGLGVGDGR